MVGEYTVWPPTPAAGVLLLTLSWGARPSRTGLCKRGHTSRYRSSCNVSKLVACTVVLSTGYLVTCPDRSILSRCRIAGFIGYASGATFTLYQVLVVDLLEGKGAGVTASNNFVRCICGAIGVSVIDVSAGFSLSSSISPTRAAR